MRLQQSGSGSCRDLYACSDGGLCDAAGPPGIGEDIFGPLIRKYLLDNRHRVSVEMLPDKDLAAQREAAERDRLAAVRSAMGPEDIEAIIKETRELKERQVSSSRGCCRCCTPVASSVQAEPLWMLEQCMRGCQTLQLLRQGHVSNAKTGTACQNHA